MKANRTVMFSQGGSLGRKMRTVKRGEPLPTELLNAIKGRNMPTKPVGKLPPKPVVVNVAKSVAEEDELLEAFEENESLENESQESEAEVEDNSDDDGKPETDPFSYTRTDIRRMDKTGLTALCEQLGLEVDTATNMREQLLRELFG